MISNSLRECGVSNKFDYIRGCISMNRNIAIPIIDTGEKDPIEHHPIEVFYEKENI